MQTNWWRIIHKKKKKKKLRASFFSDYLISIIFVCSSQEVINEGRFYLYKL